MKPASMSRAAACAAALSGVCGAASCAHAFQSMMNGHGEGQSRASAWVFPNHPPATPNFDIPLHNSPSLVLGPNLPGADPRTHALVQAHGQFSWQEHGTTEAAGGDTIDWHSMLPFVSPVATDSSGSMDIVGTITSATSATFTVTWSATDAGTAMHIGWFEGATELFETPIMIGPFSSTDTYTITSTGPIDLVMLETSMASTSVVPGPGSLAGAWALGLLALRRTRRR